MKPARPDPPKRLGIAGRRAWRAALKALDDDLQFSDRELEQLRNACGAVDLVDRLERELAEAPSLLVEGTNGQPRPHPHVAAIARARLVQARLWSDINFEADDSMPVANKRAQAAATKRWRARRGTVEERRRLQGH